MFAHETIMHRLRHGCQTMAYPEGPPPALPDRHGGALRVDAAKCADGCNACVPVCPTQAITPGRKTGRARSRPLHFLRRLCGSLSAECHHADRRPSHGRAPPRRPRAGQTGRRRSPPRRRAGRKTAQTFWPFAAVASGERRRLQRLRSRRQRARHHRLGLGPLRHPVRRLAAPRGRIAHHRAGQPQHGTGA